MSADAQKRGVAHILRVSDTLTCKSIRSSLERELGASLQGRKEEIRDLVDAALRDGAGRALRTMTKNTWTGQSL